VIARVYPAISAVSAAFARVGLPKDKINPADDYAYRAIDDVLDRLAPLLAEHKLCILPRVKRRRQALITQPGGEVLVQVALKVAFDLISAEDGSSHTIVAFGEALDHSDKATAKAMTSAYKYAVLQAFCVPVTGLDDSDAAATRRKGSTAPTEPVNGWAQWAEDIGEMVASCMASQAIDRLLSSNRALLSALAREQPALYATLGQTIAARRAQLSSPPPPTDSNSAPSRPPAKRRAKPATPRKLRSNGSAVPPTEAAHD